MTEMLDTYLLKRTKAQDMLVLDTQVKFHQYFVNYKESEEV